MPRHAMNYQVCAEAYKKLGPLTDQHTAAYNKKLVARRSDPANKEVALLSKN